MKRQSVNHKVKFAYFGYRDQDSSNWDYEYPTEKFPALFLIGSSPYTWFSQIDLQVPPATRAPSPGIRMNCPAESQLSTLTGLLSVNPTRQFRH